MMTTSANLPTQLQPTTEEAQAPEGQGPRAGVLPSQGLRDAILSEWIQSDPFRIPLDSVQPGSLDLRLGEFAWALRCSFLPSPSSTVEEKAADLAFQRIDLRDGATLERDRP